MKSFAALARAALPDEAKGKPKRRPIPDHVPRMEVELTTGEESCAGCGGTLRRLGEDGEPLFAIGSKNNGRARNWNTSPDGSS